MTLQPRSLLDFLINEEKNSSVLSLYFTNFRLMSFCLVLNTKATVELAMPIFNAENCPGLLVYSKHQKALLNCIV
jgi:hypothetical protein